MNLIAEFFVPGTPKQKGSLTVFVNPHTGGKNYTNSCKGEKDWKNKVYSVARQHAPSQPPECPIGVRIVFCRQKPKRLKEVEFAWHTVKPDPDKMLRSILDALSGMYYKDDCQVAQVFAEKIYSDTPGACIFIYELENDGLYKNYWVMSPVEMLNAVRLEEE